MKKFDLRTAIGVGAGVIVVALFFWFGAGNYSEVAENNATEDLATLRAKLEASVSDSEFSEVSPGILAAVIVSGTGDVIEAGDTVGVHYVGHFQDGKKFDSSIDRGEPLVFEYGAGQLIPGFEQGMKDMKVGEARRIVVPPELGYGSEGVTLPDGTVMIPPNATLVFEVYLVGINQK